MITSPHFNCFIEILAITTLLILISIIVIAYNLIEDLDSLPMSKNSFEIQIRKHRLISISKELVLKNEVGRAYYHTLEERI